MDSAAVEAYLVPRKEFVFDGKHALECNMEMGEMCRDAVRLDVDSCEFEVRVTDVGLPAQCRRPSRKAASDMIGFVDARRR